MIALNDGISISKDFMSSRQEKSNPTVGGSDSNQTVGGLNTDPSVGGIVSNPSYIRTNKRLTSLENLISEIPSGVLGSNLGENSNTVVVLPDS